MNSSMNGPINSSANSGEKWDWVLSPVTIRQQAKKIYEHTLLGQTHFRLNLERLPETAEYVWTIIQKNYPDLNIPYHSRWNHFQVGAKDRLGLFERKLRSQHPTDGVERAKVKWELAITSVLLDAGSGPQWKYLEPVLGLGKIEGTEGGQETWSRSEGLAVASFHMFLQGIFSSRPQQDPLRVDGQALLALTENDLRKAFQVDDQKNPLVGVEGRCHLLRQLGSIVEEKEIFNKRLGNFIMKALEKVDVQKKLQARHLLRLVLDNFNGIWPGRIQWDGQNLGDVWAHPLLDDEPYPLIPFHKLSQWLTYSLIEPLEELGINVVGLEELTGLAEYRNGGLFIDAGVLELKDGNLYQVPHLPGSEVIIEWRALTIYLLDELAKLIRQKIGRSESEFPLAKILEGGTWWAGRELAQRKRRGGGPPLLLQSDGTVF